MKREEILKLFRRLAASQGFYGKLLIRIYEANEEQREAFLSGLEEQNFSCPVDVVLFLEQ